MLCHPSAGLLSIMWPFVGLLAIGPLPSPPSLESGWESAANLLFYDAYEAFRRADAPPGRERELGQAAALLNLQPRTRKNLDTARKMLEKLAEGSNDDITVMATYLLARMALFYEEAPRFEKARELYLRLIKEHEGNIYAENSAAQLVYVNLYEPISGLERTRRFEEMEKIAPLLKTSPARLNYHLNMGNAYIDFEATPARAIEHLIAADKEGITRWEVESATWISIGELAREEGLNDLALVYYQKFLTKYRRDNRTHTVEKIVKAILLKERREAGDPS